MKHVLERFLMMYPGEVLKTFASLPRAVNNKDYVYIPGTRKNGVLLVAHADTVSNKPPQALVWKGNLLKGSWPYTAPVASKGLSSTPVKYEEDEMWEWESYGAGAWRGAYGGGWYDRCLGADDRAGIAIAWLMRRSGHSILITDHEETGAKGASCAAQDLAHELSQHCFALQVDRHYDQEMVFYDCSTKRFEQYMKRQTRFRIDHGTFTDISVLCPEIGICGVNISAGYWNEHTADETLSYDAWLRSYQAVHRLLWRKTHPRFVLPKRPRVIYTLSPYTGTTTWTPKQLPATTGARDEGIVAYQVGTMVFCAKNCAEYVPIAIQDNPAGYQAKLRQEDVKDFDVCETCGAKLYIPPTPPADTQSPAVTARISRIREGLDTLRQLVGG